MDSITMATWVTAIATFVLVIITRVYANITQLTFQEQNKDRRISSLEKKLEKVYSPMEEAVTSFKLDKEIIESFNNEDLLLRDIGGIFDELTDKLLQIKRHYGHIIFKDTEVIQFYSQVWVAKKQFDADRSKPKYDNLITNINLLHDQISKRVKENINKIEALEVEITMNEKESWNKFWEIITFSTTDFKKRHHRIVKLMNAIADGLNTYLFIIIYIFIALAMADIFLFIISPNPNFDSIISTGERGTILMATIAVLTLTYAAASKDPEKNDILQTGKYFFKSVLTFVIGMIFSIGFKKALINTSNEFSLPGPVYDFSIILMFIFLISGLAILIVSAFYFAKGITDLLKLLQK